MKKIQALIITLLILCTISYTYAISFSTIMMIGNMVGLQMPAELGNLLTQAQCAIDVVDCATSQITGKIVGEAFSQLPPEVQKAVATYNQVKSYTDAVAGIATEISVNNEDGSISGCLKTKIETKQVCGDNVQFSYDEESKVSTYEVTDPSGGISIETKIGEKTIKHEFKNIKPKDEKTNAYIKMDQSGNILEADLTTNEKGSTFVFNDKKVEVPPNTRVVYKDGKITMYPQGEKELEFSLSRVMGEKETIPEKYIISGDGYVTWTGTGLEIYKGTTVKDTNLGFVITNNDESPLFLTSSIDYTGDYENWVVANKNEFVFDAKNLEVDFLPGNNWIEMENEDHFSLKISGSGRISENVLEYLDGEIISENCNAVNKFSSKGIYSDEQVGCVSLINVYKDYALLQQERGNLLSYCPGVGKVTGYATYENGCEIIYASESFGSVEVKGHFKKSLWINGNEIKINLIYDEDSELKEEIGVDAWQIRYKYLKPIETSETNKWGDYKKGVPYILKDGRFALGLCGDDEFLDVLRDNKDLLGCFGKTPRGFDTDEYRVSAYKKNPDLMVVNLLTKEELSVLGIKTDYTIIEDMVEKLKKFGVKKDLKNPADRKLLVDAYLTGEPIPIIEKLRGVAVGEYSLKWDKERKVWVEEAR